LNLSFHDILPTPTKSVQPTKRRKQKAAMLASATFIEEALERYREKNVKNVHNSRSLAFESSSEDDVEEVSTEYSKEDVACGFCNK
jgi:hypothetical protein